MGKGKKKGKIIFSVIGFALGATNPAMFGMKSGAWLSGGLYGASLGSTLWSAFNKDDGYNAGDLSRFDKQVTGMSSKSTIPVIYGKRQWAGNQTYHKTYSKQKKLNKHVVFCEGEINRIVDVTANDLILPTTPGTPGTVFTLQNTKYSDATIQLYQTNSPTSWDKLLRLYANGITSEIILAHTVDAERDDMWDYNISIEALIRYINSLGNGWQAIPNAITKKSPEQIYDISLRNCYNNPVPFKVDAAEGETYYTPHNNTHPSTYMETGGYTGTAWIDCWLALSEELGGGNPNIQATIEGLKVYDTRKGTKVYSTNPAMCLRDFLLSKRYGLGKWITSDDIDEDAFIEAADYCDEIIQYTDAVGAIQNAKRYELNIILDQKKNAMELLGDILANFCGYLVFTNDKLALKIEKATPVSYAFSEDNIIEDSLSITQMPLEDTPNKYEISFVDPVNNWSSIKCIVEDTADQKDRQRIISKSVSLTGVTSQQQALRLGRFYRDFNKVCSIVVNFSTAMQALHLEPGDVVTVSYKGIFTGMPFRILEIKEEAKGIFSIKARQYNESIFNDTLGAEIQAPKYTTLPDAYTGGVPDVTKVSSEQTYYIQKDKTVVSDLKLTWDIPDYRFYRQSIVYYSIDNGASWVNIGNTIGNTLTIHNTLVGKTYLIKVIIENTVGRLSTGYVSSGILVTGKDASPSDLTDFIVAQQGNYFVFAGDNPSDIDFNSIEIRVDGSNWNNSKFVANIPQFPAQVSKSGIVDGTHVFRAKAVDNGGNYSENSIEYILTITGINDYKNIVLSRDDIGLSEGTLTNLVRLPSGHLLSPYALQYGDYETYADLPIENYPPQVNHIEFLSPSIDTAKVGKTGINFIFDYDFYESEITYGSILNRTYGEYPLDTYGHVTVISTVVTKVRFSDDNISWTDWQTYVPAEYDFRYIQYWVTADYESSTVRAIISSLQQYYDVPDLTFSKTLNVPSTGLDVVFADYDIDFYNIPTEISPTVINGSGNVYPDITNLTADGLHIDCYSRTGTKVSGTVLLVCKGY